jgi:uncharacterized protein (TIGR03382 family)
MKKSIISSLVAFASLGLVATSANGALLMVDFGPGSSPVATGFQGVGRNGATLGDFTVAVEGEWGDFDRGTPSGDNQTDHFYRDFIFDNNADGFTITISGVGIAANTEYALTFYSYDSGNVRPTAVHATAGTIGTSLTGFAATTRDEPTSLAQHSATGNFTSNGSGVLTFLVDGSANDTSIRSAINGFEISAIPEPSTFALGAIGLLALLRRRRH